MKNRTKNILLAIDCQNDFINKGAPLEVPGAIDDMKRTSKWIKNNIDEIDDLIFSLDSHQPIDISHPLFWMDDKQNIVKPLTLILYDDIMSGKFTPRFYRKDAIAYVKALEDQGKFKHFIWPEHCLIGTPGHALNEDFYAAIREWTVKGNRYSSLTKGENKLTEHFGIFEAQVPNNDPATQLNQKVFDIFETFEHIYLMGQAKSHCVATSLTQILDYCTDSTGKIKANSIASKLIILEDAMSNVGGSPAPGLPTFAELAQPIYDRAKAAGVQFTTTKDAVLSAIHV